MKTSNFHRNGRTLGAISIARGTPPWFTGPCLECLAPPWSLVRWARTQLAEAQARCERGQQTKKDAQIIVAGGLALRNRTIRLYTERYAREVLAPLRPENVAGEIWRLCPQLHEPILLCWEAPGEFCHRRIVAEWFEAALEIAVPELTHAPLQLRLEEGR